MKIDSSDSNNDTDIFGCGGGVRFGSNTFNKGRPSMISAKYRLKEERRKVLKISISKLKRIEDPESSLRRSVLINNTMKRLQREAREEKLQRQGIYQTPSVFEPEVKPLVAPSVERMEVTTTPCSRKRVASRGEEAGDDCDVQDVLSHFYMPPTPRLLTSIDEEDEEPSAKRQRSEIKEEPAPDPRPSTPEPPPPPPPSEPTPIAPTLCCDTQVTSCDVIPTPATVNSSSEDEDEDIDVVSETNTSPFDSHFTSRSSQDLTEENNTSLRLRDFCDDSRFTSSADRLRETNQTNNNIESSEQQHFSCGHSSIFGELQSVVFHSLIASLES